MQAWWVIHAFGDEEVCCFQHQGGYEIEGVVRISCSRCQIEHRAASQQIQCLAIYFTTLYVRPGHIGDVSPQLSYGKLARCVADVR